MTTRKRPAEIELTSCSVEVLQEVHIQQPVNENNNDQNMVQSRGFLRRWGNWAMSWLPNRTPPTRTDHADLVMEVQDVVTDTYIQTSDTRVDETTTLKRQKTRAPKSTSSTTDDELNISGRHISRDIQSPPEEDLWIPKGHSLLKKKSISSFRPSRALTPPSNPSTEQNPPETTAGAQYGGPKPTSSSYVGEPFVLHPQTSRIRMSPDGLSNYLRLSPRTKDSGKMEEITKDIEKLLDDGKETDTIKPKISSAKESEIREKRKRREREAAEKRRKLEEERRLAEIEAKKAARLRRRQPIKRLIQPLDPKWDEKIMQLEMNQNPHKVFTKSTGGTEIAGKDFATLLGRSAWLNDEIVNAYIEWVIEAANKTANDEAAALGGKPTKVPKYIAHNSFFYENLTKKGPSSTDRLMKRKGAPGKSIMEVEALLVPICRGSHWTIGVVRPLAKTIEYFDSFGSQKREFFEAMRGWLQHQLKDEYVAEDWMEPKTACARQSNGWDCGVFVCTNAFCIAFGLETSSYLERDMAQQRRNIAALLINRGFVGDFAWDKLGL